MREEHTNSYNQYEVSKLAEEKIALWLGWLHSITQGARQSLYNHDLWVCRIVVSQALRKRRLIIYEDGRQTRDFVHV